LVYYLQNESRLHIFCCCEVCYSRIVWGKDLDFHRLSPSVVQEPVPAAPLFVVPPALSGAGWLASECAGLLILPGMSVETDDRPLVPIHENIASRHANAVVNCVSIFSKRVSKPATFDARHTGN
jgi:hypothetical protein